MEKTNSRGRRNGGSNDSTTHATTPVATLSADAPGTTPGGQNGTRTRFLPALEDALIDERNDVLAVISELEEQLDRQQDLRASLERELAKANERAHAANGHNQELEWQVVTLQTRVDALEQSRQRVTQLEDELTDAQTQMQRAREQITASEQAKTQLAADLRAANKQLDELFSIRKERDGLKEDKRAQSLKIDELQRSGRELHNDRTQLQGEVQAVKAQLADVTQQRNDLQTGLSNQQARVRELEQVNACLADKIESLRADKKGLQTQISQLERETTRLTEQRHYYEAELTNLRNQVRTAEAALTNIKKTFNEVRVALTETKSRAHRRAMDAWPRIGTTLSGIMSLAGADPEDEGLDQVVAAAAKDVDAVNPTGAPYGHPATEARSAVESGERAVEST